MEELRASVNVDLNPEAGEMLRNLAQKYENVRETVVTMVRVVRRFAFVLIVINIWRRKSSRFTKSTINCTRAIIDSILKVLTFIRRKQFAGKRFLNWFLFTETDIPTYSNINEEQRMLRNEQLLLKLQETPPKKALPIDELGYE